MPATKLTVRLKPGWFVWAYKARRTRLGHYVWVQSHVVAGPFTTPADARRGFPEAISDGGLHNIKLNEDETIRAIAQEDEP